MQAGASTLVASDAGRQRPEGPGRRSPTSGNPADGDPTAAWLRGALDKIIHEQRPRIPGWGLLLPSQIVGEYSADDDYLLLVFDHRGRPHTHRFTVAEVVQLEVDSVRATARFRSLIESFCADA
jgi:hypothetical protein